jgi:PAS domain S-box-containing protein
MDNLKKIAELTKTLTRVEENLTEETGILEFILEHTTDGYWDWNIETGYEYLSPKFKQQLGYAVDEMEMKPEAWMGLCLEEDLRRAGEKIEQCISGKTDEFKDTLHFTHKQGHEVVILCRGKVVSRGEEGLATRMIGTHTIIE